MSATPPAGDATTHLITTPTVAAPGLAAAGIETCLGSASGGISLMGGGFTFGATKVDEGCTIRLFSRQLYAFGLHKAALALMCQDEHVAAAMEITGSPCPSFPVGGAEHVADVGASASTSDPAEATQDPLSLTPPARIAHTGYILDLKRADANAPVHIAFTPVAPTSQEHQAWFDRASGVN